MNKFKKAFLNVMKRGTSVLLTLVMMFSLILDCGVVAFATGTVYAAPSGYSLPSAYREVEYIQSSGIQYIDTGYTPSSKTEMYIDFMNLEETGNTKCIIGYTKGSSKTSSYYYKFCNYGGYAYITYLDYSMDDAAYGDGEVYGSVGKISTNVRYQLKLQGLYVYDASHENRTICYGSSANYTDASTICLNGNNSLYSPSKNRWYFCKISESGTVKRTLVPCYRISDNKPGMFDVTNNKFYTNAGSGEFTIGPKVVDTYHLTAGDTIELSCSSSIKAITLPSGSYKLECWGANSGGYTSDDTLYDGTGGYSYATYTPSGSSTLYCVVGGRGMAIGPLDNWPGGYNGGGGCQVFGSTSADDCVSSGGGATHIALSKGLLSSLSGNQGSVLLVAGGGGGGNHSSKYKAIGGSGGGTDANGGTNGGTGATGEYNPYDYAVAATGGGGGTQNGGGAAGHAERTGKDVSYDGTAGSFGKGGNSSQYGGSSSDTDGGSGGGGGWYGGGGGAGAWWGITGIGACAAAGGGSGYRASSLSSAQPSSSSTPDSSGNGYIRITVNSVNYPTPTAPTITCKDASNSAVSASSWTSSNSITFSWTGSESSTKFQELDHYEYSLDSGAWTTGTSVSTTTEGSHTIQVKAVTKAGMTSTSTMTVGIDRTKPAAPTISATANSNALSSGTWTKENVALSFSSTGGNPSGAASYKYSLDGGSTWTAGSSATITSAGVYTVKAIAVSASGIDSDTSESFSVKIDKTNPTYTVTKTPSTWTAGNVVVKIAATDAASGFSQMQFNGGEWKTTATTEFTVTENGTYTFTIEDVAGNSLTENVTVDTIDRAVPDTPFITCKVGDKDVTSGSWVSESATLTITCDTDSVPSGVSTYLYSLDNGTTWSDCGASGTVNISASGTHTVVARSVSTTGIQSLSSPVFILKIDRTSPTYTVVKDPSGYTAGNVTLTITGADEHSGFAKMKFNGSEWSELATNSYTVTENGDYTLTLLDAAGNEKDYTITVDNIDRTKPAAPTIAGLCNGNAITSGTWINSYATLSFTSAGGNASGIASYEYSIDAGANWISGSSVTVSALGSNSVIARAISNTGIQSDASAPFVVKIEKTQPTYTVTMSPSGYTAGDVTVSITGADADSGFAKMKFNGSGWSTNATTDYTVTQNGNYELTVVDIAGNEGVYTITVSNIDKAQPEAPYITATHGAGYTVNSGLWVNDSVTLTFSGTYTNISGISGYQYSLDNGATWHDSEGTATVSTEGQYIVLAKAVSATGVEGLVSSAFELNIDKTNPSYSLSRSSTVYTADNIILTITGTDANSGFYSMRFNGGGWSYVATNQYTVTQNGSYTLDVVDIAGNMGSYTVVVENIDKAQPETPTISCKKGEAVISSGGWINSVATVTFSGTYTNISGVGSYVYTIDGGLTWETTTTAIQISGDGSYVIQAKAVSNAGVSSVGSEIFYLNIDTVEPTLTLSGNPTDWASKAVITVSPNDERSGIEGVYWYDENSQLVQLPAPYEKTFLENGTYSFAVKDIAGNMAVSSVTVTHVDSQAPVIQAGSPRQLEIAADRTYAIIHLVGSDVGASGFSHFVNPDGESSTETEINYNVSKNGVFTFTAYDVAGNSTTKTVTVGGLKVSDDTSICITILSDSFADSQDFSNGENATFSIDMEGITNAELSIECLGSGGLITSVNGVPVNLHRKEEVFSIAGNSSTEYVIEVEAASGVTDTYVILFSTENTAPKVTSISNKSTVERSRYTESGYVYNQKYTVYPDDEKGIMLEIMSCDSNKGQYVSGYVTYNGIKYDIYWNILDNTETVYETKGVDKKGYVLIPVSAFYTESGENEDRNNTYAYVYLEDHDTADGEALSRSDSVNNSVRIQTDVTPPVINVKRYSTQYALRIGVADTSIIQNVRVTLTPKSGANANVPESTDYSADDLNSAILLKNNIDYDVEIQATDIAGHSSTVQKFVSYTGGSISDIGSGSGTGGTGGSGSGTGSESSLSNPLDVSSDIGNVYSYKTRNASYYIIGSASNDNTGSQIKHKVNFYYFDTDEKQSSALQELLDAS